MLHKPRKKRAKKAEMSKEEMDKSLVNPNSKNYVDPAVLHAHIVKWQAEVLQHNEENKDIIVSFMTDKEKKDPKSFDKFFDITVRRAQDAKAIKPEPRMPDVIGSDILKICEGVSMAFNFRGYTYRDEMVRDAVLDCVKGTKKYDGVKFKNPFSYYSQITYWAFLSRLDKEKKAHKIKMDMTFDPNLELYDVLEGETPEHSAINTEDLRGFYYDNKYVEVGEVRDIDIK